MLKKALLSVLLTISTLATAQISLDLHVSVTSQETNHQVAHTVVVDENVITPVVFDGLETLIAGISAATEGEKVLIKTQFFQTTEAEELEVATELFTVQVPLNEPATITVNDAEGNGSLVLVIIPSLIE